MTSKDWFGVFVRGLGLWTIMGTTTYFFAAFAYQQGWWSTIADPKYNVIYGLVQLAVGVLLLRCAEWIVQFAYPQPQQIQDEDEPSPERDDSPPEQ